jgi:Zn-dependent protease/Flp pilus assembly protein TadD
MFNRSFRIGRVANADIRLHWSLPLGFVYFFILVPVNDVFGVVVVTTLVLMLFVSIALHEFGHMLVALRLGYTTRQIVLWMLGGMIRLEREPQRPRDRILIFAAGPLVNLAIVGVFAGIGWALATLVGADWDILFARWMHTLGLPALRLGPFGSGIIWLNGILALFNLLPLYPLDGGQILRAALTPPFGRRRADLVALIIGVLIGGVLLIFSSIQGDWLMFGVTLFLLLLVGTLNPWFNRQFARSIAWVFHRGAYYAFHRQDYDRALAYADHQIARGKGLIEHQILRSYVLLKSGKLPDAWQAADQAVRLCLAPDAQQAMALNNRGSIAWLQGDAAAARADIDRAILADPALVHAYTSRGEIAAQLGDTDLAQADLNRAVELAPDFSEARYHRAALRFRLGDLEGARADAAHIFADDQQDMPSWSDVELQGHVLGQTAWAQQVATWADTHTWLPARVYGFIGDTLRVNGRATEAVAAYTQALGAAPTDTTLLLRRALAHQASGMLDAARSDLERVLAARPTPFTRQCAAALLATLPPTSTGFIEDLNQLLSDSTQGSKSRVEGA